MRIIKRNSDSINWTQVMWAGTFRVVQHTPYPIIEVIGNDVKGDPIVWRIIMTGNELETLNQHSPRKET